MRTRPRPSKATSPEAADTPVSQTGAPARRDSRSAPAEIGPDDPIVAYFLSAPGPVEIDKLRLESPGLDTLKTAGVKLVVPLVSQGELIGLLNLGPRLSEQEYSTDDRKLLDNLAAQAAPALRVAQLVKEQEAEIRMRERYQQELQVAQLIQQNFLPKEAPAIAGWHLDAFYRSAREVGGDFYDFVELPDGKIGIVIGDVTDKGVPAALVMASTRSVLRGAAKRGLGPGGVLERVNELVCPEMPPKMFVTCLYAVLDPSIGVLRFANAGHNLPYRREADCVSELRATGMPLGLLPGMTYDEREIEIRPGETILFSSDGVAEAHDPDSEMFGCPRIIAVVESHAESYTLMDRLLEELHRFTGPDWEQEDDITLVTLHRTAGESFAPGSDTDTVSSVSRERVIAQLRVPSEPGNERIAMRDVAEAIAHLGLDDKRVERVKTAVAEATMNAIEHGNENNPDLDVVIEVTASDQALRIRVIDLGGEKEMGEATTPDLDLKLAGEQTPRGWGLFLIKNMVDDMHVETDGRHHIVELVVRLEGEGS